MMAGALRPDPAPRVRFTLSAGTIFALAPIRRRGRDLAPAVLIGLAHIAGLLSLRQIDSRGAQATEPDLGTVAYLDLPPPTEAESPRRFVRPATVAVSDAVTIPAAQGDVVHPDKAAGFQELAVPKDLGGVPAGGADEAPVDEKDFSGRGVVGGVAGGQPPPAISAALAAAMAREGTLSDDAAAAARPGRIRPVEMEAVEVKPLLLNADEVREQLLSHYPPVLRVARVPGSAIIEFVVDTGGTIVPGSPVIISSTDPRFGKAALEVIQYARFVPGRMMGAGVLYSVSVRVRIPLSWLLRN